MKKYKVIGIMSGTSCDGLDITYCEFYKNKIWNYKITHCETIRYDKILIKKISKKFSHINEELLSLDKYFGVFIGEQIVSFIKKHKVNVDLICSHGHTVIHNPNKKITFQIGCGKKINSITEIKTVSNFRVQDVELGGQGAPLVPVGDHLLFNKYKYCLNLGGFANISEKNKSNIIGYDICPCNIILNFYAQKLGFEFDDKGSLASKGKINKSLLQKLNNLKYYHTKGPKSLDVSWVKNNFSPILHRYKIDPKDKLATITKHIAVQIAKCVKNQKTIISGGGAFNENLIKILIEESNSKIIIPNKKIINYKEAMIFGLLGVLKIRNEINCYKSVTGAIKNSVVGVINYDL